MKNNMPRITLLILIIAPVFSWATYEKVLIKDGFEIIWGMEQIEKNLILVTERRGRIKLLNLETGVVKLIPGEPEVYARGQGGLLDIKKTS